MFGMDLKKRKLSIDRDHDQKDEEMRQIALLMLKTFMLQSRDISIPISTLTLIKNNKDSLQTQYNICLSNNQLISKIMIILFREEVLQFKWTIIQIFDQLRH